MRLRIRRERYVSGAFNLRCKCDHLSTYIVNMRAQRTSQDVKQHLSEMQAEHVASGRCTA